MFAIYNKHNNDLYNKLVELSRNIFFYKELCMKDIFETRIILIFIHFSCILISFKKHNKETFPQKIYDNIFLNIEYHLREEGFGDVAVNKKMKDMNKIFYDILIKLNDDNNDNFKINKKILEEYLFKDIEQKNQYIDKMSVYLKGFYNFCFELSKDNVLKGIINYKI